MFTRLAVGLSLLLLVGFALYAPPLTIASDRGATCRGSEPDAADVARDFAPDFMPLNPEVVQQYTKAGKKVPYNMTEAQFAGMESVSINRLSRQPLAPGDSVRAIVLLVQTTDNPPGGPTTRFTPGVWDSMLFGTAYVRGGLDTTTTKTLKNYYDEISYGNVDVVTLDMPSVVGWLTAPNNYTYYCQPDGTHDNGFGPYPRNVQRLVIDAVTAADPFVDFSLYASGGVVQNLFIVHCGSGAEWSGGTTLIWSHAWSITSNDGWGNTPPALYVDGVQVIDYSMEPEAGGDTVGEGGPAMTPMLPTVGVYAHEFGHVIGLPDEYDYGYESNGTGRISLMAGGSWNRVPDIYPDCAGNSPAHPSAWGTVYLGYVTPVEVTTTTTGITIPPIETTPTNAIYKVTYPGTSGKEYWLFENRQQLGFDEGFARMTPSAHGLCIYHVDENVLDNTFWRPNEAECVSGGVYQGGTNCNCATLPAAPNGEKWYGISVEQADGLYQLEEGSSGGYWQDFYSSASGFASFDPGSVPNSSSYYNHYACQGLAAATNISEVGQTITLDLTPDAFAPSVAVIKPNGGETFTIGNQDTIRWTATDLLGVDSVTISYGINGDTSCPNVIATGETNDGEYLWTVPGPPATDCYVKVLAYDPALNEGGDISDSGFTMVGTAQVPAVSPIGLLAMILSLVAVALLFARKRVAAKNR
jgi:M6 family metalloprotease-like protein